MKQLRIKIHTDLYSVEVKTRDCIQTKFDATLVCRFNECNRRSYDCPPGCRVNVNILYLRDCIVSSWFLKAFGRENLHLFSVNKEAELKSAFCQHRHVQQF